MDRWIDGTVFEMGLRLAQCTARGDARPTVGNAALTALHGFFSHWVSSGPARIQRAFTCGGVTVKSGIRLSAR